MYKIINILLILTTIITAFLNTSCSDVLDIRDTSVISPDIWDDEANTTLYINELYAAIPTSLSIKSGGPFGNHSGYCDESLSTNKFVNGEFTSSDVTTLNATFYENLRFINMAIEKMASSSMKEEAKNRMLGQLHFMRGWSYWNLVAIYGGIPYVTATVNPFTDSQETMDVARHKTSECITYICEDLNIAIKNLPAQITEYLDGGANNARLTRAVAAAVKGRVLLSYASPQFNPDNDMARWDSAYIANNDAKQIAEEDGYGLITGLGSDPIDGSFAQIFIRKTTATLKNTEAIWIKPYNYSLEETHGWENSVRPFVAGVGGASGGGDNQNPTWELVNRFPMKDGKSTDESANYDEANFFKNRDPRFYATIAYNGCIWPLTGMEGDRIWSYKQSDKESSHPTKTGFYCRKMTNNTIDALVSDKCETNWIEIRFAEVVMNLAECANETDKKDEALTLLKTIRDRAGIEAGDDQMYGIDAAISKTDLTSLIMNERCIEFAFENKRFWDMRRRNLFYTEFNGTTRSTAHAKIPNLTGVPILDAAIIATYKATRDAIDMDTEYATKFNTDIQPYTGDVNFPITIPENYKFFAIPQNILNRSQTMLQTQGWDDGAFDPYE